jgi:hypothetical protein
MTLARLRHWLRNTPTARRPAARPRRRRSALALERLEDRITPNAVSWTGGGDGSSWADGSNWSGGAAPGPGDDVTLNTFATVNHTGTDSVQSLTLSGGTLANSGALTTGALALSSSFPTLNDTGSLTVNGPFTWTSGNLTGAGHTALNGASSLSGGFFSMLTDQTVDNHGTATIATGQSIDFRGNAVWNNDADGTFVLQGTGTVGNFFPGPAAAFNNFGTFQKAAAGAASVGVAFNNSGSVDVQAGTLTLSSGGVGGSTFTVGSGATLVPSGTYTFNGATETGAGTVQVGTFNTLTVSGLSSVQNLTVNGGTVNVNAALSVQGLTLSGGTVNANAPLTVQTLALSGGTLTGPAAVTVSGAFTWTGGSLTGTGDTVLDGASALTGSFFSPLARQVDNFGTATVAAGTSLNFQSNAVFNNNAGATLVLPDSAGMSTFFSAGSALNNAGLVQKTAPNGTATLGLPVNNTGTVDVQSGTLTLSGGGANSGSIVVEAGTTLSVTGPYTFNGGSVTGPGALTSSGTLTVGAATSLPGLAVSGGSLTANAPLTVQTLSVSNGTVTANTGSITAGNFTLSGGTLTGPGTVSVNGTFAWTGGTLSGTGDTVLNGTSTLTGSFFAPLSRQVDNFGTATVVAGTSLNFQNNAVFNNKPGGALVLPDSAGLSNFFSGGSALNNAGLLTKTGPAGTSTVGVVFNNTGSVDVQAGMLAVANGGSSGGAITAETGATFNVTGPYTLQGGTFSGPGTFLVNGSASVTVSAPVGLPNLTVSGGSLTANAALGVQSLTVSGGTVTANAALTAQNLALTGGTLTGPATITVNGAFTWTGGTLSGTGDTVLNGTSALTGSFFSPLARQVDNFGTATVAAGTSLNFQSNAVFNNNAGATLLLPDSAGMSTFFSAGSALNNAGLVQKTAPAGTANLGLTFNNTGTVDVQAGTLALTAGGIGGGTFTVESGATLSVGNYTFQGATVSGAGAVQVGTFNSLTVAGASSVQTLTINGGTVTANAALSVQNWTFSGGTLTGPATVTVTGAFNWTGGSLSGSGDTVLQGASTITGSFFGPLSRQLDNYGTATVVAGSTVYFENNAVWNNQAGATLVLPDSAGITTFFSPGSLINNAGLIQKVGPAGTTSSVGLTVNNTGTIEVDAGTLSLGGLTDLSGTTLSGGTYLLSGVLQVPGADIHTNAATVVLNGPAAELFNSAFFSQNDAFTNLSANAAAGSLTLENGKALTVPGDFSNAGAVAVGAGSAFTAGGNYTQTGGATAVDGTLTANSTVAVNGGVLSGAGTVNANVVNAALVSPGDSPGTLTVNGNYTQTAAGALTVEIGGPDSGSGYDQLAISGTATLAGAINLVMVNNYVPDFGTTFHVLTFAGHSGDFDAYNGQNIGNGRYLYQQYTAGDTGLDLLTVHLNHPPVLAPIADQTVNEGRLLTVTASATDPDDGQTLTYTLDPGAPAGAAIDPSTGIFTYTPDDGPATYQVTVRVTDNGLPALHDTQTFTIIVLNVPPTPQILGAPDSSPEGSLISLGSSVTDPSGADTAAGFAEAWSVTKNGAAYSAGSGPSVSFTPDDNGTYVVTLSATDKDNGTGVTSVTIAVFNVPPAASLSGPADGVRGQARTFTLGASDPSPVDQAAGFTYQIAWGDGSVQTVAGPSGTPVDHVYTDSGSYTVQLTATDKDGGTSAVVSQAVTIQAAEMQGTTLVVGGTTGDDVVRIDPHGQSTATNVTINGVGQGSFDGVTAIVVYGQAGNDDIAVANQVTLPALLFGGDGDDVLHGGGGNAVLVGGAGYNVLLGGSGRSVLIGGSGTNVLVGQSGDDLLIAGTTSFDNNVAGLLAVLAEWSSDRDYLTRIANLTGTGSGADFASRLNGDYFLLAGQTVFADAGGSTLVGGPGQDWFFAGLADFVAGRRQDEVWTQL